LLILESKVMNISLLYKIITIATVLFFTYSCKQYQSIYGFDTSNCRVESEIDGETHFVQLSCDKWDVQIDYGFGVYSYLESNSPEDYLRNEKWKLFAIPELKMDLDDDVNLYAKVDSVEVLFVDDSLNAKLRYLDQVYEHKIVIPEELADLTEVVESDENITKKLIYDKKTMETFQYYLINNANIQNGAPEAISVYLKSHESMSIKEATNLFESVKFP